MIHASCRCVPLYWQGSTAQIFLEGQEGQPPLFPENSRASKRMGPKSYFYRPCLSRLSHPLLAAVSTAMTGYSASAFDGSASVPYQTPVKQGLVSRDLTFGCYSMLDLVLLHPSLTVCVPFPTLCNVRPFGPLETTSSHPSLTSLATPSPTWNQHTVMRSSHTPKSDK